jgi:hypothetical protein
MELFQCAELCNLFLDVKDLQNVKTTKTVWSLKGFTDYQKSGQYLRCDENN